MAVDWPFSGRLAELAKLDSALTDGRRSGVVFVGSAGVGKTRLAAEGLLLAHRHGFETARATATETARTIPFGAVATLLPPSSQLSSATNRAEMIRWMGGAIADRYAPKRLALLIDDAHLLDDSTATLIHQLASSNSAFLLLTVRAPEKPPDAIFALWRDSVVERIDVTGLSVDSAMTLLSRALGGPVDRGTVGRLVEHTQGNIMFLRELVLGAVEDGSIRNEGGLWRQARPLSPSNRLVDLVQNKLAGLNDDQRSVLELVAFGEPMGSRELHALADRRSVEELERRGVLVSELSAGELQVRMAHPLYGDVIRATIPATRTVAVTRALAEAVEGTGGRSREDILRVATWRLTCGEYASSLMLEAAHAARWHYDFELAARLARAAIDAGAGFEAKLLALQVATLQGQSAEVEAELHALAGVAATDAEQGRVVLTQLDNLAFNLAKVDEGLALAEAAEKNITDAAWLDEIRARRASLLLVVPSGGPEAAAAAALPLLERPASGSAKVWACFTASVSLTRLGRMREALGWAAEGRAEHLRLDTPIAWHPWIHVYSRGEALAHLGMFDEADALAVEQYEKGILQGSWERQAFFAWQLATRVGEQGGVLVAIQRCREARGLYAQLGRPFFVRHCLVHLALALALAGQPDEASDVLAGLDAMDLPAQLFAYSGDLLQARAWTAAAHGDLTVAAGHLEAGLAFGERTGDLIGQATALHGLARLGHARRVTHHLSELATRIEGELVTARAEHARALAVGDLEGLHAVSAAFELMGALLLAAEAAADEAVARRRAGDSRRAVAAERRARALAAECEGVVTPSLLAAGDTGMLTAAERRAARLASAGRTNRAIALEYHLSVRTVEHQLQSAYRKLGISRREDLAEALSRLDG